VGEWNVIPGVRIEPLINSDQIQVVPEAREFVKTMNPLVRPKDPSSQANCWAISEHGRPWKVEPQRSAVECDGKKINSILNPIP